MKNPIFSINKLSFSQKNNKILDINKFDFHRGTMYLFCGSMGSGKSTLMQIFSKKQNINSGELFYEGEDISKISSSLYSKDVVFLEQINKKPWLGSSVKAYMLKKIKSQLNVDSDKVFKKICNTMKIPKYLLEKDIANLSEGEFRWVNLSISIAIDSKVLIIDYLEKSLDSNKRIILNRVLKRKTSYDGVTIIATSYNPELFKMSTSILIKMDKGRITQVRSFSQNHKNKPKSKKSK